MDKEKLLNTAYHLDFFPGDEEEAKLISFMEKYCEKLHYMYEEQFYCSDQERRRQLRTFALKEACVPSGHWSIFIKISKKYLSSQGGKKAAEKVRRQKKKEEQYNLF